ncbi:uroporphyrinogen-III C-methyltransferase [Cronobacter turicensis]|uniref:uroporphyrinogen-III C-methyltransferase n=1 Tax=Cronobacter turicensis TaxID=413502 RepID=UPI0013760A9B|nr:uroporphyrinogen-III C-methyltransferase [Cronobacter turicensis]MEB8541440.1 uroporphyrinogen-III C-methyltransferase [Cronobacter sakazakii]EKM0528732.1 uroporphyrinogen-III C-methyltransferase [Cronobacter turicensis]ELQ6001966.1 uroporphyrinogen-III C-methyltransferase [Cronobacter turicensis]ELQ6131293.1 uroporphyrinogen-III C-methyltransferase [Cronobacter turicensis]ELY2743273.1 uroporphyrinogen-III C-methyltransferase [Cronobacter turicensis]
MTEQQHTPATVEETPQVVETTPQPEPTAKKDRSGKTALVLSAVAIAIALAAGAGLWTWSKKQADSQNASTDTLATQLTSLQNQQQAQKAGFEKTLKAQADALATATRQQEAMARELDEVQKKVATISGSDAKTWQLAQADFLVKLAGRKLWSDQDATTAAALLKSADASLADMNDPSLITARRALTDDIAALASVTQVDYDGIILKLNQLSNQVDNLRLADNDSDDAPMDSDGSELSSSLGEWRQNLVKSWHNFMDSFITIRRRDDTAVPLLAPNQDIYLRENIRSRLLIAAQAVPRHQDEIYKQSLDNVSTWVRAYYDTSDAGTKAFLESIDNLAQQNISMDVPETLQSQAILEKLMQTRVRNLMAQPSVPGDAAAPQVDDPRTQAPADAAPTQGEQ